MDCIIVYTSMTGNTEKMAKAIGDGLKESGIHAAIKDSILVFPDELLNYDGILLGSYTWNNGELPDELVDFYEEMNQIDLSGKRAAVFGSGDTAYPNFCKAVEILEERLLNQRAMIVLPGLKMEQGPIDTEIGQCRDFGKRFARMQQDY